MTSSEPDRLRNYLDLLTTTLDDHLRGHEVARRAYLSRFHFDRLVRLAVGEPPAALRRRVLLERAAHQLLSSHRPVTEIALAADYAAPGSFTRAFARAFGTSPSLFRTMPAARYRLPAPNGIHYLPPAGLLLSHDAEEESPMDLIDRLVDHDVWLTAQILEASLSLTDSQLDATLIGVSANLVGDAPGTLRQLLERLVWTKEMWVAAMGGTTFTDQTSETVQDLCQRWREIGPRYAQLVRDVRDQKRWNDAFIDATCEPPETFTFGGAISHILSWTAFRRTSALGILSSLGVPDLDGVDPIDWERRS